MIQNKYHKWYFNIINNRKNRIINDYTEKHHIIPKSMGGDNSIENLIALLPREHFLCHWLLTKFTSGKDQQKMLKALHKMTHVGYTKRIITSWQYEIGRKAHSMNMTLYNPMKNKETRLKSSISHTGYITPESTKIKMSNSHKGKKKPYVSVQLKQRNAINNPMKNPATVEKRRLTMLAKGAL